MFGWLVNLFMGTTADAALNAAIYSADCASIAGMHQMEEPKDLQKLAKEYKSAK